MSNFLFSAADAIEGEWPWPTFFYVIQPWANNGPGDPIAESFGTGGSYIDYYNGQYYPQNFSVSIHNSSSSAAPEPPTWAMMLVGFAGLGYAGFRQTRKSPRFV